MSPPFKTKDGKVITDRYGEEVGFYRDVPEILDYIKNRDDMIAVSASRTNAPEVALKMLKLLTVENSTTGEKRPSIEFLEETVWGIGSEDCSFQRAPQENRYRLQRYRVL